MLLRIILRFMEETFFFFLLHLNPKTDWVCKVSFEVMSMRKKWWDVEEIPQGPHSHILMTGGGGGGVRQRFIFYTPKNPNFRICLPKKIPTFFSIPKKIPQCFCISKFYYLSSGKLKHANFNFGFGKKQNYKLRLCYF